MIPYIITFITAPILLELSAEKTNYRFRRCLILLSILILCFLGTFRDISIGTDVLVYQLSFFNKARVSNNFLEFCKVISNYSKDYMYLALTYICARISGDIHLFFFTIELVTLVPIYYVLWNDRGKYNSGIALLAYCLLFYVESFNVVRQILAVSYSFLGLFFLNKNKKIGYLVIAISFFFHSSAILTIFIPGLYLITKMKNRKSRQIIILFICVPLVALAFNYGTMINLFIKFGLIPIKYLKEDYMSNTSFDLPLVHVVVCTIAVLLAAVPCFLQNRYSFVARNHKETASNDFMLFTSLITIIIVIVSSLNPVMIRVSWYFEIYNILIFASGYKILKKTKHNRILYNLCVFSILLLAWIYNYVIVGNAKVFPYEFMF